MSAYYSIRYIDTATGDQIDWNVSDLPFPINPFGPGVHIEIERIDPPDAAPFSEEEFGQ